MKKYKKILIGIFLIFFLSLFFFFFAGKPPRQENIMWGVNFSQKHAEHLGLDWRSAYLALLDDLGIKRIKLITHWDQLEPEREYFYFDDVDWQIQEAKTRGTKLLLVIGMKTPRWPECHIPEWAKNLSKKEQQERILNLLKNVVLRYKESEAIWAWQVENEPFFPFGDCPWADRGFVQKEVALVKSLDRQKRPVVITDSGEGSLWFTAAYLGDIVGITTYKKVWVWQIGFYLYYPIPEIYYYRKAKLIEKIFGDRVIDVELQAEPWGPKLLYDLPVEEQEKTMNLEQFKRIINFAKGMGFDEFYLWGSEWWYWLKEKQNSPVIWNEARKLFETSNGL